MNDSVIVYGPQGCGKTRNAEAIAAHLGLSVISEGWPRDSGWYPVDTLYLTDDDLSLSPPLGKRVMPYDEVIKEMGGHVTEWFDAPPQHVGVYEVEDTHGANCRWFSYWDGHRWHYHDFTPEKAYKNRNMPTHAQAGFKYRGLAEQPDI